MEKTLATATDIVNKNTNITGTDKEKRQLSAASPVKTGLVMEGGAMRGMFTSGVIDVMLENGIEYDAGIGVSAGAAFGCNYKSRQIGRSIRYNIRFCKNRHYCSLWSLITTGDLYGAKFCYEDIPYKLDPFDVRTYQSNPMKFYVVCTDLEKGRPVYKQLRTGDRREMLYFRASASMPIASRIVEADGRKLLDGGMSDSIPLRFMEKMGYERNVVILTQPMGYVKEPNRLMPLLRVALRKYPNSVRLMETRHRRYNRETAYVREQELAGKAFVIRPPKALEIGSAEKDPLELLRVYEIGRSTMLAQLPQLKAFLGQ